MENAELEHTSRLLAEACSPEEIFGKLEGTSAEKLAAARKIFLRIAKVVHPDTQEQAEDAEKAASAFKRLAFFWEQAQAKIGDATYGVAGAYAAFAPFVIQSARGRYRIERLLTRGDLCNLYVGVSIAGRKEERVLLKAPLRPQDNDLVANEARILKHLRAGEGYRAACHFISRLVDAFPYEERATGILRQMTILSYQEGLFSLREVKDAYPDGIDAKDMAWIWRRLLVALDFAHTHGVIHGSVLPTHILIQPEQHGVVLIDWSYALLNPDVTHERVSAISTAYREWYPAEVFAREEPQPGLDIYMAGSCMIELLGGDPRRRTMPDSVPRRIQNHLRACTLPGAYQRLQDAHVLLKAFDELLERIWGPRTFHAFSMPGR